MEVKVEAKLFFLSLFLYYGCNRIFNNAHVGGKKDKKKLREDRKSV